MNCTEDKEENLEVAINFIKTAATKHASVSKTQFSKYYVTRPDCCCYLGIADDILSRMFRFCWRE